MDSRIYSQYLKKLRSASIKSLQPSGALKYRLAEYIDITQTRFISEWQPWTPESAFPLSLTTLLEAKTTIPAKPTSSNETLMLRVSIPGLEGIIRFDGEIIHGADANRSLIPIPETIMGQTGILSMEFYRSTQVGDISGHVTLHVCEFVIINKIIERFYFDLLVACETIEVIQNRALQEELIKRVDSVLGHFDITAKEPELTAQCEKASKKLQTLIEELPTGCEGSFSLVGHSHIDTAWLWRIADTRRKIGHTFSNMLALTEEFPEFVFTASQAQQYEWAKTHYPRMFERIKSLVKAGRWEAVGGMWVEPDMNMIAGESVVRQLLYGCGFFEEELGAHSSVAWLPDTFGFQGNLPQLLRLAGIDSFYTYKVNWQNKVPFPHTSFVWKGIDGSSVVASAPDHMYAYNGDITPKYLVESQKRNKQPALEAILPFGFGDGGGGPTREMLAHSRRLGAYPGLPKTRMEPARDYFDRLAKESKLPVWTGELPVNTHRGTLTSQALVKQYNRRCEQLLRQAEIWHTLSRVSAGKAPQAGVLSGAWKDTLLLQFHDILPGSSIAAVYDECREIYPTILSRAGKVIGPAMDAVMGSSTPNGELVVVLNSLSWPHTGFVRLPVNHFEPGVYIVEDTHGKSAPAIIIDEPEGRILFFFAHDVPAFGTEVYRLTPSEHDAPPCAEVEETEYGYFVRTARYEMKLRGDGVITSLINIDQGREIVSQMGANLLNMYFDGPQEEDAWNIYESYKDRLAVSEWENNLTLMTNDSVYVEFLLSKTSANCVIYQAIRLYTDIDRIDFKTHIDWSERHRVLKVESGFELICPTAFYETGFGAIARPTYKNDPFQQQQCEVAGQRWVDISEGDYGVSLMNDCKYGFDVTESSISMTLLRGTDYPDPNADEGAHVLAWSIYPHAGTWQTARTVRRSHEFNAPLVARCVESAPEPFIGPTFEPANYALIIDTIKPAEKDTGTVLRIYECNGLHGRASLKLNMPARAVYITDLLENKIRQVEIVDGKIDMTYSPYQVQTFLLEN